MVERILRLPEVKTLSGKSRSTIYLRVDQGLFPPPIKLGERSIGWPERDIAALNDAHIRGASDDEIRVLVTKLSTARKSGTR